MQELIRCAQVLRQAAACRAGHDPQFMIHALYELSRRLDAETGPGYVGCPVCAWVVELLRILSAGGVPHTAVLDAEAVSAAHED